MNVERLLAHYQRIADAPDSVPRLRKFILDLAVRGKLVPQAPKDEPAEELLKRISAEKERLVKPAKLQKASSARLRSGIDPPFDLPAAWIWSRLGDVAQYGKSEKVNSNREIPIETWVLDLEDIEKDTSRLLERASSSTRPFQSAKTVFQRGDVLFGKLRPYLNKSLVADQNGVCTTEIIPIRGYCGLVPQYVVLVLKSPLTMERVNRLMYGMKMPRLGTDDATALEFPLPPLAEQHRIVARVEELMTLCDQLESSRAEREARRDRLATATLARLNAPDSDSKIFAKDARFAFDNLSAIVARPDQIKQIRQTILNLAVRGKLVPQDPRDEPAGKLLREWSLAKEELVKSGSVPQPKKATRDPSRMTSDLPDPWVPVALGDICSLVTSGSRGWGEFYADSGPGFIRAQNIRFGKLIINDLARVNPPTKSEGNRTRVMKGDLLVVITGAGVTNPAVLDRDLGEAYVSQHVALVRPTDARFSRWLLLCLMAPSGGREELIQRAYGAGKPGLNLDNIRSLSVPLAPLAEQARVLAKVDALMDLCDQLEATLAVGTSARFRLLEALLSCSLGTIADNEKAA